MKPSLENQIRQGIKSSRRVGLIFLGISLLILIVAWFFVEPNIIDPFEILAIAYSFGCGMGAMAGMDQVRVHVKDILQPSGEKT